MNAMNPTFVSICLLYGIALVSYLQQQSANRKKAGGAAPGLPAGTEQEPLSGNETNENESREIVLHALSYQLETITKLALLNARESDKNKSFLEKYNELFYGEQRPCHIDWEALYPLIDILYSGFVKKIRDCYASLLSEKEIQLCCLLRIGMETKEIACVLGQSVHTVRKWKTGIRKKTGMPDGADIPAFLAEKDGGYRA